MATVKDVMVLRLLCHLAWLRDLVGTGSKQRTLGWARRVYNSAAHLQFRFVYPHQPQDRVAEPSQLLLAKVIENVVDAASDAIEPLPPVSRSHARWQSSRSTMSSFTVAIGITLGAVKTQPHHLRRIPLGSEPAKRESGSREDVDRIGAPHSRIGTAPCFVVAGPLELITVHIRLLGEAVEGVVPRQRMPPLVQNRLDRSLLIQPIVEPNNEPRRPPDALSQRRRR